MQRNERRLTRMKVQKCYGRCCPKLRHHMRVHCDLMTKHKNSSLDHQNKPEPQRRKLQRFQMFLFCFKRHCEHQLHGFLQVKMVGMRRSNKKKLLKKKDGERNLHFASCPPEGQAAPRETRRAERKKLNELQRRCY